MSCEQTKLMKIVSDFYSDPKIIYRAASNLNILRSGTYFEAANFFYLFNESNLALNLSHFRPAALAIHTGLTPLPYQDYPFDVSLRNPDGNSVEKHTVVLRLVDFE